MIINKQNLKGVSNIVVKLDIKHDDYINSMSTNNQVKKNVIAIRSVDHQTYTIKHDKIGFNSFDNKMITKQQ